MIWEKTGGEGLWTEYTNTDTGDKSIKEHKLKVVKKWCDAKHHEYVIVDMRGRKAQCSKCGQELTFIVGKHEIDDTRVYI